MRVFHLRVHMLEVVVQFDSVGPCGLEPVCRGARFRIGRIERDRAQVVRKRQRVVIARLMESSLSVENRRSVGRERFGAIEGVARLFQPPQREKRISQTDERVNVLRLHRENRTIHISGVLRMAHPRVEPGNPDASLDIVRIRGRQGLKLFQGRAVGAGVCRSFRFGTRIGRDVVGKDVLGTLDGLDCHPRHHGQL